MSNAWEKELLKKKVSFLNSKFSDQNYHFQKIKDLLKAIKFCFKLCIAEHENDRNKSISLPKMCPKTRTKNIPIPSMPN